MDNNISTMEYKKIPTANVYNTLTLKGYDFWVINVLNRYAWRCHDVLLPHFRRHARAIHLDVGVGTGYFPAHAPQASRITLLDINPHCLHAAKKRIGEKRVQESVLHNVFLPLAEKMHKKYDSISLFHLLHCLPGGEAAKESAVKNIAATLKEDGVLFGDAVLGVNVKHNFFGRRIMSLYNKVGIFDNRELSADILNNILSRHFKKVEITTYGTSALFSAQGVLTR